MSKTPHKPAHVASGAAAKVSAHNAEKVAAANKPANPPETGLIGTQPSGAGPSAAEDAANKPDPVGGERPTETTLPRSTDSLQGGEGPVPLAGTETLGVGPAEGQPKDTTPMPAGGPYDPAGATKTVQTISSASDQARPPSPKYERERTLVPTGIEERVSSRKLPYVEDKPVIVLERSHINNVIKEAGDRVESYTGYIGSNLKLADA